MDHRESKRILQFQYFGYLMQRANSLEKKPWCWERLKAKGEEGNRGWVLAIGCGQKLKITWQNIIKWPRDLVRVSYIAGGFFSIWAKHNKVKVCWPKISSFLGPACWAGHVVVSTTSPGFFLVQAVQCHPNLGNLGWGTLWATWGLAADTRAWGGRTPGSAGAWVPAASSMLTPAARWQSTPLFMIRGLTALRTQEADDESCEENIVIWLFIVSQVNMTLAAAWITNALEEEAEICSQTDSSFFLSVT